MRFEKALRVMNDCPSRLGNEECHFMIWWELFAGLGLWLTEILHCSGHDNTACLDAVKLCTDSQTLLFIGMALA